MAACFPLRVTAALLLSFAALASPAVSAESLPPGAIRPPEQAVSLAYFQERLSQFGKWIRHPVWGDVWQPDAGRNFRPYFYGYWQYTSDYGWLWVSNEPYGDLVYHYGRWVFDPNFGWLWVPGYIWGPSWVVWRETDSYVGWFPMPPGYQDFITPSYQDFSGYTPPPPAFQPDNLYGYQNFYSSFPVDAFLGLWVFAPNQDFGRGDRRRYIVDREHLRDLYGRSHDRTHYVHDREHDRVTDRSIDKNELERLTHRNFTEQQGRQFLRPDAPIVSVSEGQNAARRERQRSFTPGAVPPVEFNAGQGGVSAGPPAQNAITNRSGGFAGRFPFPRGVQDNSAAVPGAGIPSGASNDGISNQPTRMRPPRGVSTSTPNTLLPPAKIGPSTDGTVGPSIAAPLNAPITAPQPDAPRGFTGRRGVGRVPVMPNVTAIPSVTAPLVPAPPAIVNAQPIAPVHVPIIPQSPALQQGGVAPAIMPPPAAVVPQSAPASDQGLQVGPPRVLRGFAGRTGL